MKKHTFEYVKQYFKDKGCELLEKEYKNSNTKMKYRCKCGNISEICFNNFKNGQRCKKCSGNEKLTYKYVYNKFKDNDCELLEKKYKNNMTKMKYKCKCGNISKICFSHFKNGQRCRKCSGVEKLTLKYVRQYFKDKDCELLEKEYINAKTKMKYRCDCGNISKISFSNFKKGRRCQKCSNRKIGEKNRMTHKFVYDYFEEQGCKLLEKKYIGSKQKLKYMCSCGNISEIIWDSFKSGSRCKKCGIEKISGKNSYLYNDNLTEEQRKENNKKDRNSNPEYRKWRKEVYERDNYVCQCCYKTKDINGKWKKINAHHIKNYATNKELRFEKDNGITMCKSCHMQFHYIYGYKDNNQQQLDEFLKQNSNLVKLKN